MRKFVYHVTARGLEQQLVDACEEATRSVARSLMHQEETPPPCSYTPRLPSVSPPLAHATRLLLPLPEFAVLAVSAASLLSFYRVASPTHRTPSPHLTGLRTSYGQEREDCESAQGCRGSSR